MSNPATIQEKTIHDEVSKHYAGRINSGSCCGPAGESQANATAIDLYADVELTAVPMEAAQNSFGCGNPTAIASLHAGETVLDLGSGGGLDAFLAARQVGETGFVYGVDMTDEMLALARRNAEQGGFTNVEFRKGQIERLPVDDQSVDVIISNCVINLSPDKEQTLREAYRALRPGGRLAVSDIVIDGTLDDLPVSEEQVRAALSWAGCIAGALTIDDFRRTLETAGFVDVKIDAKHRYKLAELGQDMESVAATLTPEVAEKLVRRFVSANIQARRAA
ncbi:MAG: arsenite methyltransferase [Caldilineaceae bacterium]|nr:arsenite methyltransferase [Caldilineaceae bacterium]